jgi:hypothetical protein
VRNSVGKKNYIQVRGYNGRWGRTASDATCDVHRKCLGGEWLGTAVAAKVAKVQNMDGPVLTNHTGAVAVRAALESAVQLGREEQASRDGQPFRNVGIRSGSIGSLLVTRECMLARWRSRHLHENVRTY